MAVATAVYANIDCSGLIKGIGPKYAKRIVATF